MALDFNEVLQSMIVQFPFAGAGIYVARIYMNKHEEAVQKLVSTFESEVKACEKRYEMVFKELMSIKDKIK